MDSSRRVWAWTGAALSVACAALGGANFLLTRLDENPPAIETDPPTIQSAEVSGGSLAAPRLPQGTNMTAQPGDERFSDLSFETSHQAKLGAAGYRTNVNAAFKDSVVRVSNDPAHAFTEGPQPYTAPAEVRGAKTSRQDFRNSNSIDNRQPANIHSIKPLGIVEKADGRVQAVIQEGEWTRLVEEGEILADNSRVLRITAEGVEVSGPREQSPIMLARAGESVRSAATKGVSQPGEEVQSIQPETEWAWSGEQVIQPAARKAPGLGSSGNDLPGLEQGVAAYKPLVAEGALRISAPAEPKIVAPAPSGQQPETISREDGDSRQSGILGTVTHADGRVVDVLADGQWIRLVPGSEPQPGPKPSLASSPVVPSAEVPVPEASGAPPHAALTAGAIEGGYKITDSLLQGRESTIQNLVEPIGVVEWSSGRTQAVIAQGNTITLLEGQGAIDMARSYLASRPPPEESPENSFQSSITLPGRTGDDEEVWLVLANGETLDRSPPEAGLASDPGEVARGQPGAEVAGRRERPPPGFDGAGDGPWLEDLPGIDSAPAAGIEPTIDGLISPRAIPSEPDSAHTGSVSKNESLAPSSRPKLLEPHADKPEILKSNGLKSPKEPVQPLGFIRSADGGLRVVILFGGSVMLVKEGDRLADGSLVRHVGPEGVVVVELRPSSRAGNGSSVGSHPGAETAHQTSYRPQGARLLSDPPVRDNR